MAKIKLLPNQIPNALRQAFNLQKQGRSKDAQQLLLGILAVQPKNADALQLLGVIAADANDLSTAQTYLLKAHKARPESVEPLVNLAGVSFKLKAYSKAATALEKARELRPDAASIIALSGAVQHALGDLDGSLQFARQACELEPNNSVLALTLANYLVDAGQIDDASAIYRRISAKKDISEVTALVGLSKITKFNDNDPVAHRLIALAKDRTASSYHGAKLLYAAGKVSADRKAYDQAFAFYKSAKDRFEKRFQSDRHHEYCNRIKTAFDADFFKTRRSFESGNARHVFIVGMPRSGTTLTEQICASHQEVAGAGELHYHRNLFAKLGIYEPNDKTFLRNIANLNDRDLQKYSREYLDILDRVSSSAKYVIDKMPLNFESLGLIAILYPEAKVIHCTRDPLDTCLSCYMNDFSDAHSYNNELTSLGLFYREYRDLMAHWSEVLPLEIYESSYEALTSDPESATRGLIDFLDLDWDPACLEFNSNAQLVTTPSKWQVRQPIYRSSVKKWKKYEKHLGPLIEALGDYAEV